MRKLRKEYVFTNFTEAMAFVHKVARVAERENHHPDIHIYYNKVIVEFWTHATRNVTEKDFDLVKKIDQLV